MTNIEALVAEYGTVMKAYGRSLGVGDRLIAIDHSGSADRRFEAIRNALTEQAEAFRGELQAYDGMVRELTKTVEDMRAVQSVPVVGEPTDAAYKWMIANGVEPMTSLHKLGERLAALLDEDQFSECEALLLTAITAINTFVPVPAAELATLREKEKDRDALLLMMEQVEQERDELRKALLALKEDCQTSNDCQYGTLSTSHVARIVDAAIDAAIAQGKGE